MTFFHKLRTPFPRGSMIKVGCNDFRHKKKNKDARNANTSFFFLYGFAPSMNYTGVVYCNAKEERRMNIRELPHLLR